MKKIICSIISLLRGRKKEYVTDYLKDFQKDDEVTVVKEPIGPSEYQDFDILENDKKTTLSVSLGSFSDDLIDWGMKKIAGFIPGGATAFEIFNIFMKSQASNQMAEVMKRLEVIEAEVRELILKVKTYHYENAINERNTYVREMQNAQLAYLTQLEEAANDNERRDILDSWASVVIGGNNSLIQFKNFIGSITDLHDGKTLYEVYDEYVYNAFPWENQGYRFREEIRLVDLSIILSQARLAILYYTYTKSMKSAAKTIAIESVKEVVGKYIKYCQAHPVVRHEDVAICQIPGCHIQIERDLMYRNYRDMSWFPRFTNWDWEHSESAWVLLWGADCGNNCKRTISEVEFKAITGFYGNKYDTFGQILRDGGVKVPGGNAHLVLQCDCYTSRDEYDDYFIAPGSVCIMNSCKSITKERIGSAYLERHGFLWLEQWFNRWAAYYGDKSWYFLRIKR